MTLGLSQGLDDVVHQRVRLGVLAVLSEADVADFGYLKGSLGLTDGTGDRGHGSRPPRPAGPPWPPSWAPCTS